MVYVLVRHKVADFNRWKEAFDADATARKRAGEIAFHVFRSMADASDLFLLLDWESADQAKKFMSSGELRERMQQAGVEGIPEIQYLEDARTVHRSAAD
jgi:quinol monooxygenase YgiN